MYKYNICTEANKEMFYEQCNKLEKNIPNIIKGKLLHDVDDSLTQMYTLGGKEIKVLNSEYIDSLTVNSEIDIEQYIN